MASELARRVSTIYSDESCLSLADIVDTELREVREVLNGLIVRRWKGNEPIQCWCDAIGDDEHRAICQRTRALMSKLGVIDNDHD